MTDRQPTVGARLGRSPGTDSRYDIPTEDLSGDDLLRSMAAQLVYGTPGRLPEGWYAIEDTERRDVWSMLRRDEQRLIKAEGTLPSDQHGRVILRGLPRAAATGPSSGERYRDYMNRRRGLLTRRNG